MNSKEKLLKESDAMYKKSAILVTAFDTYKGRPFTCYNISIACAFKCLLFVLAAVFLFVNPLYKGICIGLAVSAILRGLWFFLHQYIVYFCDPKGMRERLK